MLSENGAFGVDASPKNLCKAFLRETKRRLTQTQMNLPTLSSGNVRVREKDSVAVNPDKAARNKESEEEKIQEEQEEDRIRAMTGRVVNTGLGKIIKHADGSFEF
jgi:hypothetical protein